MVQDEGLDRPSTIPLLVGYGEVEITPPRGTHLAGVVARRGRKAERLRDRLCARALFLATPEGSAVLVVADLLLITSALHAAVAARLGIAPERLLLAATHNHSGPGQYWDLRRGALFMGPYRQELFDRLAAALAEAGARARGAAAPARAAAAAVEVVGASANRRQRLGPVDPELALVRFDCGAAPPISLVCFGAHPVVGCEREPHTCSADFPGELCRRLERRGDRAIFFTGAVGGTSPLFPEFPLTLDQHLTLLGDLLERAAERAARRLEPLSPAPLEVAAIPVVLSPPTSRIFPQPGARYAVAEAALTPVRRWLRRMAEEARSETATRLGWLRLGRLAWLGTPADLGVNAALALKRTMRAAGVRNPLVGSQCNDYVGYVHMPDDYRRIPQRGFRWLAAYENAMSLSGHDAGQRFVAALQHHLRGQDVPAAQGPTGAGDGGDGR